MIFYERVILAVIYIAGKTGPFQCCTSVVVYLFHVLMTILSDVCAFYVCLYIFNYVQVIE